MTKLTIAALIALVGCDYTEVSPAAPHVDAPQTQVAQVSTASIVSAGATGSPVTVAVGGARVVASEAIVASGGAAPGSTSAASSIVASGGATVTTSAVRLLAASGGATSVPVTVQAAGGAAHQSSTVVAGAPVVGQAGASGAPQVAGAAGLAGSVSVAGAAGSAGAYSVAGSAGVAGAPVALGVITDDPASVYTYIETTGIFCPVILARPLDLCEFAGGKWQAKRVPGNPVISGCLSQGDIVCAKYNAAALCGGNVAADGTCLGSPDTDKYCEADIKHLDEKCWNLCLSCLDVPGVTKDREGCKYAASVVRASDVVSYCHGEGWGLVF